MKDLSLPTRRRFMASEEIINISFDAINISFDAINSVCQSRRRWHRRNSRQLKSSGCLCVGALNGHACTNTGTTGSTQKAAFLRDGRLHPLQSRRHGTSLPFTSSSIHCTVRLSYVPVAPAKQPMKSFRCILSTYPSTIIIQHHCPKDN